MRYENFPAFIVVPNPWDGCPVGKKSMCKICNPLCSKIWIKLIGPAIGRGLQQIDLIQSTCGFINNPAESGGDSLLKMIGMLFISLRGVNFPNCTPGGRALIFSWRGGGVLMQRREPPDFRFPEDGICYLPVNKVGCTINGINYPCWIVCEITASTSTYCFLTNETANINK